VNFIERPVAPISECNNQPDPDDTISRSGVNRSAPTFSGFIADQYELDLNAVASSLLLNANALASLFALIGCSTRITSDMVSAGFRDPKWPMQNVLAAGQWLVMPKHGTSAGVEGGQRRGWSKTLCRTLFLSAHWPLTAKSWSTRLNDHFRSRHSIYFTCGLTYVQSTQSHTTERTASVTSLEGKQPTWS